MTDRTSRRLFVETLPRQGGVIPLGSAETHYLCNVLRLRPGARLLLCDGSGRQAEGVLHGVREGRARVAVQREIPAQTEAPVSVHLGIGLLKAPKMDLVIQKVSELGAEAIHPLTTSRTVPCLAPERWEGRLARWRKIAREASRQSGRTRVAQVDPPTTLERILERKNSFDLRFLFSLGPCVARGELEPPPELAQPRSILVLVGPEGGFSAKEEQIALSNGCLPVGLGPRTLRAETAAILAVGLVLYRFGDLRPPVPQQSENS